MSRPKGPHPKLAACHGLCTVPKLRAHTASSAAHEATACGAHACSRSVHGCRRWCLCPGHGAATRPPHEPLPAGLCSPRTSGCCGSSRTLTARWCGSATHTLTSSWWVGGWGYSRRLGRAGKEGAWGQGQGRRAQVAGHLGWGPSVLTAAAHACSAAWMRLAAPLHLCSSMPAPPAPHTPHS